MPDNWTFEIVPLSDVPFEPCNFLVKGLQALHVDDGKAAGGLGGVLKQGSVSYEVRGLRKGHHAWITQDHLKCQLVQEVRSGEYEWLGEYPSVQDALHALSKKMP